MRSFRIMMIAVGATIVFAALADRATAGVIISVDAAAGAHSGMQPASSTDGSPVSPTRPTDHGRLSALSLLSGSPGAAGSGASSGGSVSPSVSTSALVSAACELPLPELVSAVRGEGPLFFQPPPVFELLRPPKV